MSWVIHTDGGSRGNPGPAALGFVILRDGVERLAYGEFLGTATNNVAEYTAVLRALQRFSELAAPGDRVEVRADSKLVVEQLSGRWKIKHADMRDLALKVKRAYDPDLVSYTWVAREHNARADEMANKSMDQRGTVESGIEAHEVTEPAAPPNGPVRVVVVAAPMTDQTLTMVDRLKIGADPRFLPVRIVHRSDAPSQDGAIRLARHLRSLGAEVQIEESRETLTQAAHSTGTVVLVASDAGAILQPLSGSRFSIAPAPGSVSVIDSDEGALTVRALGVFL